MRNVASAQRRPDRLTRSRPNSRTLQSRRVTQNQQPSIRWNLTPSRISDQYDESQDLSKKIDDIDYQERQDREFLKIKLGLTENQIREMDRRRNVYLAQLQLLSQSEKRGSLEATAHKNSLNKAHIQWMLNYLGPENYLDYLNLTTQ